jgi:hypothetical protein
MADDWDSPAEPEYFKIADHVGSLCIFEVNEVLEEFVTSMGPGTAVKAAITVVDGPGKGDFYEEALLFGRRVVPQLRSKVGGVVLGTITKGTAKPGQSAPYQIEAATEAQKKMAAPYRAKVGAVPRGGDEAPF